MISPSPEQSKIIETLLAWIKKPSAFITVGGYAGTGKTTVISLLRKKINKKDFKVSFCAFTGKAAMVLKSKLDENSVTLKRDTVSTIHALIYTALTNEKTGEIIGWERKKSIATDLIIIDEASMVNKEIWDDLLTYKIPIIAIGDHGQLPPINGVFNLLEKPQLRLEKIHRQAAENPIIKLSMIARESGSIPVGRYSDTVLKINRYDDESRDILSDKLETYDTNMLILCGYNKTRIALNNELRAIKEKLEPLPMPGDRIICLKNNHKEMIFNGMLGTIITIDYEVDKQSEKYYAQIKLDFIEKMFHGYISAHQFNNPEQQRVAGADLFDYGYALTVHKAQGSQAKRVVLFEERFPKMNDEEWKRWLYTGITRAEEELLIVGK